MEEAAPVREHARDRARDPVLFLTVVMIVVWTALTFLAWRSYSLNSRDRSVLEQQLRAEELRGGIVHMDEVLTMSARMAAATGNPEWERRYRRFEPTLDATIKEAMSVSPEASDGAMAAQTEAANVALVAMENRAFDLVRQGHADKARKILFGEEYEEQKRIYAQGMTHFARRPDRHLRLVEVRGIIVHLDEVLTMSARMAAATGDPLWEQRYRRHEPQLDATIKEAIRLAPEIDSGDAAAKTDAANIALVAMENRAFALVRQGRIDEAQAVLFGDEYETQKQIYADGMTAFANALTDIVGDSVRQGRRRTLLYMVALIVPIPLLVAGWFVVFNAVRSWQATLVKRNRRLSEQAEEVAKLNRSLDQKVVERTQELAARTRALGRSRKKLQREIDDKNDFLRTVSHDLGAPLRNILGMADSITRRYGDGLPDQVKDRLARVRTNAQTEIELIGELLELSRIRTRQPELAEANIGEIVRSVTASLADDIEAKSVSLTVADDWPTIRCEKARISQMFQNLIDNAVKYMGDRADGLVEVGWHEDDGNYVFHVKDNGAGIAPEDKEKIFYVFRRSKTAASQAEGKGVGLAAVKAIAETYDGEAWVESELGQGSTFFFSLAKKCVQLPQEPVTA